ncbi:MAG: hypothetical protein BWZ00_01840 [Bacteroidetes bacterium ADurb.BinA174]|nr:MAG: hypothetical protein BWZ00_01840 [Bacteroidetes bacterium ADurb.BinA174]
MIRNPIDAIVLPKPCFRISTTFLSGSAITASSSETINSDANALSFVTDVKITISKMLNRTKMEMVRMLILCFYGFPGKLSTNFIVKSGKLSTN